jgi:solute carrier family 8 (sodium/calcium exchanger)
MSDAPTSPIKGQKSWISPHDFYLVSWSKLQFLLTLLHCAHCQGDYLNFSYLNRGSCLIASAACLSCDHVTKWSSQENIGDMPKGNIMMSAAILLSGSLVSKTVRLFQHLKLTSISCRTFFRHQKEILFPVISRVWKERQEWLVASLLADEREIVVGGDGRSDTPGHSAKFGSYTMMELKANVIIDMQLVQVNIQVTLF